MKPCKDHKRAGSRNKYASGYLNGKKTTLHRQIYCQHKGIDLSEIDGLVVRHDCDNPRCIDPTHLRVGTQKDNTDDRSSRSRTAKGERHGRARLDKNSVQAIRSEYKTGGCSLRDIAAKYNVHNSTIERVIKNKTWKEQAK